MQCAIPSLTRGAAGDGSGPGISVPIVRDRKWKPVRGLGYNAIMVLQGIVQNGVVVLGPGANVPEGTQVSVYVPQGSSQTAVGTADVERRRAALAAILALPDENPGDTFSGADHDKVLYGEAE